jgi:hypothetical protein
MHPGFGFKQSHAKGQSTKTSSKAALAYSNRIKLKRHTVPLKFDIAESKKYGLKHSIAIGFLLILLMVSFFFTPDGRESSRKFLLLVRATRELLPNLNFEKQALLLDFAKKVWISIYYEKTQDFEVGNSFFENALNAGSKCLRSNSLLLFIIRERKGIFEAKFRKWCLAESDLRLALQAPVQAQAQDKLIAQTWLALALRGQSKNPELVELDKENLLLAEELAQTGDCQQSETINLTSTIANDLDRSDRVAEATPYWEKCLNLSGKVSGKNGYLFLECSPAFKFHEQREALLRERKP